MSCLSGGLFFQINCVVSVIQTQHPEDALRARWAAPSFAMREHYRAITRDPLQ